MVQVGQLAVVSIISHMIFFYLTWRVIIALDFDPLIRKGKATEARVLLIFITIVIGSGVSRFFLDLLQWVQDLTFLL